MMDSDATLKVEKVVLVYDIEDIVDMEKRLDKLVE